MTLDFRGAEQLWHALAGVLIAQHNSAYFSTPHGEVAKLLRRFRLYSGLVAEPTIPLEFHLPDSNDDVSIVESIADASGLPYTTTMPRLILPEGPYSDGNHIVIALGDIHPDFELPVSALRAILRLAKTYTGKVYMIGLGKRPEVALMENEILFQLRCPEKEKLLSTAKLVIGTPNDWTWLASAWQKKIVVLYADSQPMRKWFPFADDNFGRVLFSHNNLDIANLVAQVRVLIKML